MAGAIQVSMAYTPQSHYTQQCSSWGPGLWRPSGEDRAVATHGQQDAEYVLGMRAAGRRVQQEPVDLRHSSALEGDGR